MVFQAVKGNIFQLPVENYMLLSLLATISCDDVLKL